MPQLVEYQERWPAEFARVARALRASSHGFILAVDHIGSTAIPGLLSKDCIDVQVTVKDLDPSEPILSWLSGIGLQARPEIGRDHRPPQAEGQSHDWEKLFASGILKGAEVHVHLRAIGAPNQRYPLVVRDYLRANPSAAEAYGRLKVQLAAELRDDSRYPDVKDPACDLIWIAAEDWARSTGWTPQPSYGARTDLIYHITRLADWQAATESSEYRVSTSGRTFDEVGFIHCAFANQVAPVANAMFTGSTDLVVLAIAPELVQSEIRYENLEGGARLFPHVYGALNASAVVGVETLETAADGSYRFNGQG